jgi:beta-glucosidase/6-phospho-beta-glucosidase/beta-galactosidase
MCLLDMENTRKPACVEVEPIELLTGSPPVTMDFLTGFESTYIPDHDTDILETTRHLELFEHDLGLVAAAGIRSLRYPVPWHRIEQEQGHYDWTWMDAAMAELRRLGLDPIVDPIHHTSFPAWLDRGFLDDRFVDTYAAFVMAFAERYPWVLRYTPFNEPMPTTLFCADEGIWKPYEQHERHWLRMARNVAFAVSRVSRSLKQANPAIEIVHVDTCEAHHALDEQSVPWVHFLNDRRFLLHDLILGRVVPGHRLYWFVEEHGIQDEEGIAEADLEWLAAHPAPIDVLGLDYYAHSEQQFHSTGTHVPSRTPYGFAEVARQYLERYNLPIMLTETNIRGFVSDRLSWLKYMVEQSEQLIAAGVDFRGFCWFPFVDSTDWDSLLRFACNNLDPVGVYWLDEQRDRHASEFSDVYAALARHHIGSAEIPAYRFLEPVSTELSGFLTQMSHWEWREP